MTVENIINKELARLKLLPLVEDQIRCLHDPDRLDEAAGMVADLRDRCGIRLPVPAGAMLGGPYDQGDEALREARAHRASFTVVAVDRMATDESRSTGDGDEYYIMGYSGPDAAVALASQEQWIAYWVRGDERAPEAGPFPDEPSTS